MRKILLLYVLTLLSISFATAQEVCDDGLDNDGDGFVDCYDSDCTDEAVCDGFYLGNDASCEAEPSEFPKFLLREAYKSDDFVATNLSRIAIGDLDRDGIPEVLSSHRYDDKIYILNGDDASIKYQATTSNPSYRSAAMANVDNDNCGEVFIINDHAWNNFTITAFDCELNHLWTSNRMYNDPMVLSFADFDGDGKVEMYYKDEIRDAHTGNRIVKSGTYGSNWNKMPGGPVAVDIDGDEDLELVVGNKIFSVDLGSRNTDAGSLTLKKTMPGAYQPRDDGYASGQSATTSVADYNLDGYLDIIVTGADGGDVSTVFLWDVKNNTVKTYQDTFGGGSYKYGWKRGMGRVNVADIDGDGLLNAVYVSGKYLYALDENWNQLWRSEVNEETSGITGCTLFDFNGDGKSEIVYRDEDFVYIINGDDGSKNPPVPCRARTSVEYPIVADVDADGSTEICVVCASDSHKPGTKGKDLDIDTPSSVRVYKSGGEAWVPARRVWNQHAYFNVNINDDLSVPKRQQKHHLVWSEGSCTTGKARPLNSFLNQSPFLNSDGCPTYASPDLSIIESSFSVTPPDCPDQDFTVSFDFENLGDVALSGTVPITFYEGDPMAPGATKLNTDSISLSKFEVGDVGSANNIVVHGSGSQFTLYAVFNDDGSTMPSPITFPSTNYLECAYDNNIVTAEINPVPFALSTEITKNITCSGDSAKANGSAEVFRVIGGNKVTADYDFHWFNGTTVTSTPDYTGSIYTGLDDGIYTVFATNRTAGCSSDTVQVVIQDSARVFDAEIAVDSGNNDCANPNGELTVTVNDANGDALPAGNFTYEWYEGKNLGSGLQISNSQTASGLEAKTYTVVVTEKSTTCQTIASKEVPDDIVIPDVQTSATDIVCSDKDSGKVEASVVGGTASDYTFEWYSGSSEKPTPDYTGSTVDNLPKGTYSVKVTHNSTSCESVLATVKVEQTQAPEIDDITSTATNSCDPSRPNGSVSLSIVGSSSDHTIEWFAGTSTTSAVIGTGLSVDKLSAGVYTAKLTNDDTGCSVSDQVTVVSNIEQPVLSLNADPVTTCSPFNGKVAADVSIDNVSDYTFYWYDGKTVKSSTDYTEEGNSIENLEPGFYTVQALHNTRHCLADAVTIEVLDQAIINITQTDAVLSLPTDCSATNGVLRVEADSPGNTSGFLLEWYKGASVTGTPFLSETGVKSSKAENLTTGLYTVVATDLDNGCSNDQIFNLPFADAHKLETLSTTDATTCSPNNEGSITVQLTPTTLSGFDESDYELYLYNGTDYSVSPIGTIAGVDNQSNYTFSGLADGSYTIEAFPNASVLGACPVYSFAEIELDATDPVVNAVSKVPNTNCSADKANGSIEIAIDSGADPSLFTINWFEGNDTTIPLGTNIGNVAGSNGEIAAGLIGGNYTVEVLNDTTLCSTIRTYSVVDNPVVVSIPTSDLKITPITRCDFNNSEVEITNVYENGIVANMSNYTFEWYDENGNILPDTTNSIDSLAEGSYSVMAINVNTDCATSKIDFTIENDIVEPTISLDFTQPEQCVTPGSGELHVTATAPSTTFSYNWYDGKTTSGTVVQTGPDYINLGEGFYTVEITDSVSSCIYTETYELVTQVNAVNLSSSATAVTNCDTPNGSVFATVTSAGSYSYNWTDAEGNLIGTTKEVDSLSEGEYTVVVTDITDSFCENTATVVVSNEQIIPQPKIEEIAPLSVCDLAMANGTARATVDGGYVGYTFEWFEGTEAVGDVIYVGPEYSKLKDVTYTVRVTDNISQCFNDVSITISADIPEVEDPNVEILSDDTHCQIDNGLLKVDVGGNIANYLFNWYKGDNAKGTVLGTGDRLSDLAAGKYTVTATDLRTGCTSAAVTAEITEILVYPEFDIEVEAANCGQNNGMASVFVTSEAEIATIEWYNSSGSVVTAGPILSEAVAGDYTVSITTINGCSVEEQVEVPTEINVYNGISRSGGDSNSFFKIDCITQFPNNNVKIYNRAGTLVYEANDYDNNSTKFTGVSNRGINVMGENVPDGTYFYVIDKNDGSKPETGYLEIVN